MVQTSTTKLNGTTLAGRAREHVVLSDRTGADGGGDLGCTSGELMLLAIGSCVVGNLNAAALRHGADIRQLSADVRIDEGPEDGYGAIIVDVRIGADISDEMLDHLRRAAGSGRVTGRLRQNSEVRIALNCTPATGAAG